MTTMATCTVTTPSHNSTGKERDSESGLDNFGARYNSSSLGRFMSPDPDNAGAIYANPQSWNGYAYALNNPVRNIDPYGTNVLVCVDGQSTCHNYTDAQYARLLQEQNGQQGINLPNQGLPHGDITCGGVKCGTANYFDPGMAGGRLNFPLTFLFIMSSDARAAIHCATTRPGWPTLAGLGFARVGHSSLSSSRFTRIPPIRQHGRVGHST
jgi:RHS repeat-associated protein